MKEAYGGIFNMLFIVVFLVVAIGVLGLTFSYTKAFKMKSAIIATIEEYEGHVNSSSCKEKILREAKNLGYSPVNESCPSGFTSVDGLYCYSIVKDVSYGKGRKRIYKVLVRTDISFPLMKNIFGFSLFQVSGDTREIIVY